MRQTTGTRHSPGEKIVKDIKRATRKHYSSEEKIKIVLDGLRGEDSIAELCRREGISQGIYYKWSKDFMEAGKKRLAGDTARAANTDGPFPFNAANSNQRRDKPYSFWISSRLSKWVGGACFLASIASGCSPSGVFLG